MKEVFIVAYPRAFRVHCGSCVVGMRRSVATWLASTQNTITAALHLPCCARGRLGTSRAGASKASFASFCVGLATAFLAWLHLAASFSTRLHTLLSTCTEHVTKEFIWILCLLCPDFASDICGQSQSSAATFGCEEIASRFGLAAHVMAALIRALDGFISCYLRVLVALISVEPVAASLCVFLHLAPFSTQLPQLESLGSAVLGQLLEICHGACHEEYQEPHCHGSETLLIKRTE